MIWIEEPTIIKVPTASCNPFCSPVVDACGVRVN
jgi:hypothetical protein